MLLNTSDTATARWLVRGGTFAVWALALASTAYWGLKATSAPAGPVAAVQVDQAPPADPARIAALLGARPAQAAAPLEVNTAGRFTLAGVLADVRRGGAALISVDGKPAKPYRVGSVVDEGLVLQSVAARRAVLGAGVAGPATFALELPSLKPAGPQQGQLPGQFPGQLQGQLPGQFPGQLQGQLPGQQQGQQPGQQ